MTDKPIFTVTQLKAYLDDGSWTEDGDWQGKLQYYIHADCPNDELKVPIDSSLNTFQANLDKVIEQLSTLEERTVEDIISDISSFDVTEPEPSEPKVVKPRVSKPKPKKKYSKPINPLTVELIKELDEQIKEENEQNGTVGNILTAHAGRDKFGHFIKGNKVGNLTQLINGSTIRKYRAIIAQHIPELLDKLIEEAKAGDKAVGMWLVNKVLPDVKAATFTEQHTFSNLKTLTDVNDHASSVLTLVGDSESSIEEGHQLMDLLRAKKEMIEAADIDPMVKLIVNQYGLRKQ